MVLKMLMETYAGEGRTSYSDSKSPKLLLYFFVIIIIIIYFQYDLTCRTYLDPSNTQGCS